ncbi:MAG: hypothetical protein ACT4NU_03355, partial [Chromatiales bacterium]
MSFAASLVIAQTEGTPDNPIDLREASEVLGVDKTTKDPALSKVNPDLFAIYSEHQAYLRQAIAQGAAAPAFKSRNPLARIVDGYVVIDA